jgi:nitroreductase
LPIVFASNVTFAKNLRRKFEFPMPVNEVEHPILPCIADRWSPYRFEPREVEEGKLLRCLEAARWAASSFNDQPWHWIVARRQDSEDFQSMLSCLLEANQAWAANAGVLMLTAIRKKFAYNGKPNRVALHDLGQAACQLSLEATECGLQAHQMAGVNLSRVRQQYAIPDDYEPQTAIAIGYASVDPPETDQEKALHLRESGPRQRRSLTDQVFSGTWGDTARFVDQHGK